MAIAVAPLSTCSEFGPIPRPDHEARPRLRGPRAAIAIAFRYFGSSDLATSSATFRSSPPATARNRIGEMRRRTGVPHPPGRSAVLDLATRRPLLVHSRHGIRGGAGSRSRRQSGLGVYCVPRVVGAGRQAGGCSPGRHRKTGMSAATSPRPTNGVEACLRGLVVRRLPIFL